MKHHTYILVSEKYVEEIKGDFGKMIPLYISPEDYKEDKIREITRQGVRLLNESVA